MCEEQLKIFQKVLLTSSLFALSSASFAETSNSIFKDKSKELNSKYNESYLIAENPIDYTGFDTLKITVTGSRTERTVFDFPGSIEVFDYDELNAIGASSWRELFRGTVGIDSQDFIRSDYGRSYAKGDTGNINIRGLEGNRVLTQIDGITIPRFSYGNGTFAVSRFNFIDLSNVGNVEVIKGSGSSLYGSDALGGVVSLKSIEPDDILKPGSKEAFKIDTRYKSQNSSIKPTFKYAFKEKDFEGIFAVSTENYSELERKAPSKYIDNKDGDNNSFYGKFTGKPQDNIKYSITLENIDKSSINKSNLNNINSLQYSSNLSRSDDQNDSKSTRGVLDFEYKSKENQLVDKFNGKIYLSSLNYQNKYIKRPAANLSYRTDLNEDIVTELEQETIGASLQFSNNISNKDVDQRITFGFEGSIFEGDRTAKEYYPNRGSTDYILQDTFRRNPESDVVKYGIYLQDEITKGKWDAIIGLRYDSVKLDAHSSTEWYESGSDFLANKTTTVGEPADVSDSSISPDLKLTYRFNDNTNIYGKYSRGFRNPSWEEVNSSHINIRKNSTRPGYTAYSTIGNPNLKSETSDNYEIGIKSKSKRFDFYLAGYYQKFKNFLDQSVLQDEKVTLNTNIGVENGVDYSSLQASLYRTENVADANIIGVEANSVYYFSDKDSGLSIGNSFAFQDGEDETADQPLRTINPFTFKNNIKYIFPNKKFVANLTTTYTGEPTPTDKYKSGTYSYIPDSYFVTDLAFGYKVNEDFSTNLGIYNIFDTTYYKWSDLRSNGINGTDDNAYQRYAQPGTSIVAGFNWRF